MKILSFLTILLLSALSGQAQDFHADVNALGDAWVAAFERGDAAALAATYADEVELINDDGSVRTATRAEIEASWQKTFAAYTGSIELGSDDIVTRTDDGKARAQGSFTQTMTDKQTGKSSTFDGYYDHQAVQVDGAWRFCRMKTMAR
jgi:uncharacterized protein (TIGR02246 family)